MFYRYAAEDPVACGGDECCTKTFKYPCAEHNRSRKAESAGETFAKPYVRTDCAEFKPVEMRHWAFREAGSPVTRSGEEVTIKTVYLEEKVREQETTGKFTRFEYEDRLVRRILVEFLRIQRTRVLECYTCDGWIIDCNLNARNDVVT